jgi:hypothetical protein
VEVLVKKRCERNRNRSKGRRIKCPLHGCLVHSVSQKHALFANSPEHLQTRGLTKQKASIVLLSYSAVSLDREWLEEFWCDECQDKSWYHVKRTDDGYVLSNVSAKTWQQSVGTIDPYKANASVSEFSVREANRFRSRRV